MNPSATCLVHIMIHRIAMKGKKCQDYSIYDVRVGCPCLTFWTNPELEYISDHPPPPPNGFLLLILIKIGLTRTNH